MKSILALGAESVGRFCIWSDGDWSISADFGSLLDEQNAARFKRAVEKSVKERCPRQIVVDLHPAYSSSRLGEALAGRLGIPLMRIQHHAAHIGTGALDHDLKDFVGLALDGAGYGLDGDTWGAEVLRIQKGSVKRVGSVEKHRLIGGDAAVREPARLLLAVLSGFLNKKEIYPFIRRFYNANQFELLCSQMQQSFNCPSASSAGRILDAAGCLLFGSNSQGAAFLLTQKSHLPYTGPKPVLVTDSHGILRLQMTPLFKYLLSHLGKDKRRLAGAVQKYLAEGMLQIASRFDLPLTVAGGAIQAGIIHDIFKKNGALFPKKNPPGDGGIAVGQVWACLNLANAGH